MVLNQSYVLKGVVGDDMFNEIKSFMVNPLKESRESMDTELYKFIWENIYEEFKKNSLNRMKRLRNTVARCIDLEAVMDINETIADIQYDIDCTHVSFSHGHSREQVLLLFLPRVFSITSLLSGLHCSNNHCSHSLF